MTKCRVFTESTDLGISAIASSVRTQDETKTCSEVDSIQGNVHALGFGGLFAYGGVRMLNVLLTFKYIIVATLLDDNGDHVSANFKYESFVSLSRLNVNLEAS